MERSTAILVAILAGPVLSEQVHTRQWLGFALGFIDLLHLGSF